MCWISHCAYKSPEAGPAKEVAPFCRQRRSCRMKGYDGAYSDLMICTDRSSGSSPTRNPDVPAESTWISIPRSLAAWTRTASPIGDRQIFPKHEYFRLFRHPGGEIGWCESGSMGRSSGTCDFSRGFEYSSSKHNIRATLIAYTTKMNHKHRQTASVHLAADPYIFPARSSVCNLAECEQPEIHC